MKTAQDKAKQIPPPEALIPSEGTKDEVPAKMLNAIVPLGGLILFHITGLWLDGGGRRYRVRRRLDSSRRRPALFSRLSDGGDGFRSRRILLDGWKCTVCSQALSKIP
jgi:hypothetical protein